MTLRDLIDHMRWADARTLASLRETPDDEALRLFGHVLGAEKIWLERMRGEDPWPQDFWQVYALDDAEAMIASHHEAYTAFLEASTPETLAAPVAYRNSKGTRHETAPEEIMTHLAMHGSYHRGQIAARVRAAGGTPAVTDFIYWLRERPRRAPSASPFAGDSTRRR